MPSPRSMIAISMRPSPLSRVFTVIALRGVLAWRRVDQQVVNTRAINSGFETKTGGGSGE